MSFKRAAAELFVTPTAVSHQMRLLERSIGLKLFDRYPQRLVLTAAGQQLYPVLREGFDAFARAIAELKQKPSHIAVTVSATPAFTARWLIPRVPLFRTAFPHIDLRLHASNDLANLQDGTIDAAIRYGSADQAGLVAEELFADVFAPVCSPHLGVSSMEDLRSQTLIHFEWRRVRRHTPTWRRWLELARVRKSANRADLVFSDESHAIQAAIAGHGVALLSRLLVADELASGALVQPFDTTLEGGRYFLAYPQQLAGSEKIGAIRSWIMTASAATL
jgi:LysR family glycine cleavage system transcriptional activator